LPWLPPPLRFLFGLFLFTFGPGIAAAALAARSSRGTTSAGVTPGVEPQGDENGELLSRAADRIDALLTMDRRLDTAAISKLGRFSIPFYPACPLLKSIVLPEG
jgi:hypothetical protein